MKTDFQSEQFDSNKTSYEEKTRPSIAMNTSKFEAFMKKKKVKLRLKAVKSSKYLNKEGKDMRAIHLSKLA